MKRRTVIGSPYWMAPGMTPSWAIFGTAVLILFLVHCLEVIQETSCKILQELLVYSIFEITFVSVSRADDGKADIWSLGITLMELCEGSPPHFNVHPMRAIFIISSKPAPTLKDQDRWSKDLHHFLSQCLVKDCEKRASAADLLAHPWIQKAVKEIGPGGRSSPVLANLVNENWDEIEKIRVARFKLPENIPVCFEHTTLICSFVSSESLLYKL